MVDGLARKKTGQQADRFGHTFQHALFGAGAFLFILGVAFGAATQGSLSGADSLMDALSQGFTAAFFAMFAGVLSGVGIALFADGLVLGLRGNKVHVAACALLSLLSLLLAFAPIANATGSGFFHISAFFAGVSASGALALSAAVFGLSAALRNYLSRKKE